MIQNACKQENRNFCISVKGERGDNTSEKKKMITIDYVRLAQEWAKGQLTGIDVSDWSSLKPKDDGQGNIKVEGTVWRTYPHGLYFYDVRITKDGIILGDSYVSKGF
jgi:hypothetical protein